MTAPQTAQNGSLRLAAGRSLLLPDGRGPAGTAVLEVVDGVARLACEAVCPGVDCGAFTVAFLQSGDRLSLNQLCAEGIVLEALSPLSLRFQPGADAESLADPVSDWTLQLLRLRHLPQADQRLQALFGLLVERFGRRCGAWCDLPFHLSHGRIAELIGTTRVTTTRLLSRIRQQSLLITANDAPGWRLAASWIEAAPLIVA
ncbi:MAG: helix-turn-helix domain-containing protein [Cyanobacteriota bacterium]